MAQLNDLIVNGPARFQSKIYVNDLLEANSFKGNGERLTKLNAEELKTGKIPVDVLPVIPAKYGGTGQTSLNASANALINSLSEGTSNPVDNDYYISQWVNGGTSTTTYHRRPMKALWNWINSHTAAEYDTITSVNGKIASAEAHADSAAIKVKDDLLNGAGTAYDTLKELSDLIINNKDAIAALENFSNEKFLPKAGGNMTGQIKTSFKNAVATGSYQAVATKLEDLLNEVRYSSGCMGSVNLTTAYDNISVGWYNFIYIPHRSGGVNGSASGDNCNYGTLLLYGMTVGGAGTHWRVQYSSGKIGTVQQVIDTWRGIQNNLSSTSTTDSLSAYQGKVLNENKMPYSGGRFTGPISFQSSSLPQKSLSYICGIDALTDGGQMGWQSANDLKVGYASSAGVTTRINVRASSYTSTTAGEVWIVA